MTCWCHPQFGVFVRAFPTQVLTISTWCSTHKLFGNFDQSIAVPTNMLNRFQSSCDRQHRQQPLLHNSKRLFSRHKCVLSWAGGKNEGEMRMLSESVDTSTRKYGLSACWLHTRSSSALPAIRTVYASVARTLQTIHLEEMESYDREKGGLQDYTYTLWWKLNPSQVKSISHGQSKSPILVWCHSCLKIPTQLPYSTASWIWPRKPWDIWIQIRLLCWRWTSRSPQ